METSESSVSSRVEKMMAKCLVMGGALNGQQLGQGGEPFCATALGMFKERKMNNGLNLVGCAIG